MNLVAGAQTFPVLVRRDMSLERSKDAVYWMEAQGWGDLAVVLWRNLAISQGLHTVNALLLALYVWEVERIVEGVPVQDPMIELEMDCFWGFVAK